MAKILVPVAHDDDAILGVGGRILQHSRQGDEVKVIICTDGRHSHKAVLGIEDNPSPSEVMKARSEEIMIALSALLVPSGNIDTLGLWDCEGTVWGKSPEVKKTLEAMFMKEAPDIVYFQYPDAHVDHRAVGAIVSEILQGLSCPPEAFQFVIWTKELAADRPEVDASQVPEIPSDVVRIDIGYEIGAKRRAMHSMRSQVDLWPYPEWQVQRAPILDKKFLDYFLVKSEEILIRYNY